MDDVSAPQASERQAHVERLLVGAIDLHCHSGPSVMARRVDHIEATLEAEAAGMRGILFKEHYQDTSAFLPMIRRLHPDLRIEVMSGIVLNCAVGGFNPWAVDHALAMGARVVWMPTVSAANHIRFAFRKSILPTRSKLLKQEAMSVLDSRGQIIDPVKQVLDVMAAHDAVLAGGHLHVSEQFPLFEEAASRGVMRRYVNHPTYQIAASLADIRDLASMGVMMEHSACMFIDCDSRFFEVDHLQELIEAAGPEMTLIGSDLGQTKNPQTPVQGFREIISAMIDLGHGDAAIRAMVGGNAARLVGLDPA